MTRRSPTTWPVHLTPTQLRDACDAAHMMTGQAVEARDYRRWRRLALRLERELDGLCELPEVRRVLTRAHHP